jgi:hypothetical protein
MKKINGRKEIQNQTWICGATVVVADSAVAGSVAEQAEDLESAGTNQEIDQTCKGDIPSRAGVDRTEGTGQQQEGVPSEGLGNSTLVHFQPSVVLTTFCPVPRCEWGLSPSAAMILAASEPAGVTRRLMLLLGQDERCWQW